MGFSSLFCLAMAMRMLVLASALAQSPSGAGKQLQTGAPRQVATAPPRSADFNSSTPTVANLSEDGKWRQRLTIDLSSPQTLYASAGDTT
jgi:hypothetical protein